MVGAVGDGAWLLAGGADEPGGGGRAAVPATGQLFVPRTLRTDIRSGRGK